jgi:hypothetical protein
MDLPYRGARLLSTYDAARTPGASRDDGEKMLMSLGTG